MSRLSNSLLSSLRTSKNANASSSIRLPSYDRSQLSAGILHLGVGQFHRSHMAEYTDSAIDNAIREGDAAALGWGICGVGLMPQDEAMRDALREQDHLFSLTTRAGGGKPAQSRVIGSHCDNLWAASPSEGGDGAASVIARLASPTTRIVSLTVTEKGYCADLAAGALDMTHALIAHDLAQPESPRSAVGFLAAGLKARYAAGLPPVTVLSCDNIQGNGEVLRELVSQFVLEAKLGDAALERWIRNEVAFPCTMVDRITPGASAADAEELQEAHGVMDAVPVSSEDFTQWVVEDAFVSHDDAQGARPRWPGAIVASAVEPYEKMKLRLLNASHSCLAYVALLRGHTHVHTAMGDPAVRGLVEAHMREVRPTVPAVPGVDLDLYCTTLLERFANEAVADTVLRLAEDGAMKMPGFLGPALRDALHVLPVQVVTRDGSESEAQQLPAAQLAIGAWIRCLVDVPEMLEPRIEELRPLAGAVVQAASDSGASSSSAVTLDDAVRVFLQCAMPSAELAPRDGFRAGVAAVMCDMHSLGPAECIQRRVHAMQEEDEGDLALESSV